MKKIVFVVPYEDMKNEIINAWNLHGEYYKGELNVDNSEFDIHIEKLFYSNDVVNKKYNVDTIVARGATAQGLKLMNKDIPIIEIPISPEDIKSSIFLAREKYGDLRIGVFGTKNMIYAAELILDKEKYNFKTYAYKTNTHDIIAKGINYAVEDGSEIIVSGMLSLQYCIDNNIKCQNINTSSASLWQAITEAKRAACIFNEERRRAMQYKTITDYAYEGIISFNTDGKIQLINSAAKRILNIYGQDTIGEKINNIIPGNKICQYFNSKYDYDNVLVNNDHNKINLNKVKLIFEGQCIGTVATFEDVTSILDAEARIRLKINRKGHIAKYIFTDIIGSSSILKETIERAGIYAKANSNILLYGETGTGKELFAQAIHNYSERKKGPFVAINCAALTENLLESELFGYVDGAFTGAAKGGKMGLFEMAHKGTLFLDEISEIPFRLQGRLLRSVQEREIMRLGDDKVIPIDVRIICATNKKLNRLVSEGLFREDLYFRLDVLSIQIPPLRERDSDVVEIMEHFLRNYSIKMMKYNIIELSSEAKKLALSYQWKGNIRELRNICERLVALDTYGIVSYKNMREALFLTEEDIKEDVIDDKKNLAVYNKINSNEEITIDKNNKDEMENLERKRIIKALLETKYSKTETAKKLGISRATLWRKIKELDI